MNITIAADRVIRTRTRQDLQYTREGLPLMADLSPGEIAFKARHWLRAAASGEYMAWEELAALALAGMISADRVEQGQIHSGDAA